MKPILSNFHIKLGKLALVLAMLLIGGQAWAQMSHAVIYSPSKEEVVPVEDIKPTEVANGEVSLEAVRLIVPDIKCKLSHSWVINTYKEYQVWYAYVTPEELKCVAEAGDVKFWSGATAKEAWIAAYKSGLPDAVALFEQNVKYPVSVLDSETGKQVEKYMSITDAKALGTRIEQATIDKQGDAMLPRKIFDGSK